MEISTFLMFPVTKPSHELERQSWLTFQTMVERTHNRLFRLHMTLFVTRSDKTSLIAAKNLSLYSVFQI